MEGKAILGLVSLCAILCVKTANGRIGMGSCPEVNVMRQFDIPRYAGRWFEIRSFGAYFEFNGKCVQAVYTPRGDGTIEVLNSMVDKFTNRVRQIKGSAVRADDSGDGRLSVTFSMGWVNRTGPYWVLDTDYENFAVVYVCRDLVVAHYDIGWILSRRPVLEEQYMGRVESILTANNMTLSQFSTTLQDCPGVINCSNDTCQITPS